MADQLDRSEKATPKRRGEARNRGQVAKSLEISSEAIIIGGLIALTWIGPKIGHHFVSFVRQSFASIETAGMGSPDVSHYLGGAMPIFGATALFLGILVLFALVAGFGQVGFEFAEGTLTPKWENLNPVNGFQRLFSWSSVTRAVISIIKMLIIFWACKSSIEAMFQSHALNRATNPGELVVFLMETIFTLGWRVVLILGFIAAADYGYQKWNFERQLKMTKQEVKEENKNTEGNPLVRGKIRGLMRQRFRQAMMKAVPKATVIITNPTHVAIAIQYDRSSMKAPRVVAKGLRLVAERIKEIARENQVPIIENKPLARGLYRYCQLGSEIPSMFYQAVAIVLAQVYKLAGRREITPEMLPDDSSSN